MFRLLLTDAEVPGKLEVIGVERPNPPHLKGSPFPVTVTVENVGDDQTEDGTVIWEGDADITPASKSFEPLSARASVDLDFEVAADEAATFVVSFGFKDRDDHTDQRIEFEVLGKEDLIDSSDDILESLRSRIEKSSEIRGGFERSLLKKLEAAADSLQRAKEFAAEGRDKQANNVLDTATKQLGAFLNAFDSQASKGNRKLPAALARRIRQQAESAIDNAATAKDAAI